MGACMKSTFSKSVEAKANAFLSEHNLTLDQLTQPQRQLVLKWISTRKNQPVGFIILSVGLITNSWACWAKYTVSQNFIQKISGMSTAGTVIDWELFGDFMINCGISGGMSGLSVFLFLLFIVLITVHRFTQKRYLNLLISAFQPIRNDQTL
jgi:hypothetical protein